MIHFDRKVSPECPSGFELDRLLAGEAADATALRRHLAACEACAGRLADMERMRDRFRRRHARMPDRTLLRVMQGGHTPAASDDVEAGRARQGSVRVRWPLAGGALAAAAAAALALVIAGTRSHPLPGPGSAPISAPGAGGQAPGSPPSPAVARTRPKGSRVQVLFYVTHRGALRLGGPGEIVHPGDILSFSRSSPEAGYLAILSLDGSGSANVYLADGEGAVPVPAGEGVPLRQAVKLDGVLGRETLFVLACGRPVAVEPLRRALAETGAPPQAPPGCRVDTIQIEKRSP